MSLVVSLYIEKRKSLALSTTAARLCMLMEGHKGVLRAQGLALGTPDTFCCQKCHVSHTAQPLRRRYMHDCSMRDIRTRSPRYLYVAKGDFGTFWQLGDENNANLCKNTGYLYSSNFKGNPDPAKVDKWYQDTDYGTCKTTKSHAWCQNLATSVVPAYGNGAIYDDSSLHCLCSH
jgi:hypothetical protein